MGLRPDQASGMPTMQSKSQIVKQSLAIFVWFIPTKLQSWRWLAIGAMALCLTATTVAQVCAPQPSSWWPGDGNATDLVAGNNGTLVGNVTFAQGEVGQAFSFKGSGYVSFGITPSIIGTGPLTIELWLKTGGDGFIITQRDSGNINGEYLLSVGGPPNGFGFAQVPGHLCWSEFGDGKLGFNFCSVTNVADNLFHHVAVTREVDGTGRIYIDGSLDSIEAAPLLTLVPLNVYLGEDVRDSQAPFTGLIDEVTIYNTPLTQQAIRTIFLQGSTGKCKVGCGNCPRFS
jgi:Concanavalin A-like lectin/glucanases superfamily